MRRSLMGVALVAATLALGLLAFGSTLQPGSSEAQTGSMHNCPQAAKWAISVWEGPDGTDTGQALGSCGAVPVVAAYYLDPQTQGWSSWFAGQPGFSTLSTLNNMQAVVALGSASAPVATPTPTSTPTPTPKPAPGTVLYQADWSQGPNGWPEIYGWKWLDGMLVNDGTNTERANWVAAPYAPETNAIADYAVEAEIQLVRFDQTLAHLCGYISFGVVVRGGYWAGHDLKCSESLAIHVTDAERIASKALDPDNNWHKYRVEVMGNTIRLLVDGSLMIDTMDNRYVSGGKVGLWSDVCQVNVRSFKVIAL